MKELVSNPAKVHIYWKQGCTAIGQQFYTSQIIIAILFMTVFNALS
jgi:hypothetical protein